MKKRKTSRAKKTLKIKQATVDAFSRKLRDWSKTLPADERNLVSLLVDRATAVNVGDLGGYDLKAKIRPEAEQLFKSLRRAIQSLPVVIWSNLDPDGLWLKSTTTRPPGWTQAPSIIVDPGPTRTRGAGN